MAVFHSTPLRVTGRRRDSSHPRPRLDALSLGWAGPAIAGPASAPPFDGLAPSATRPRPGPDCHQQRCARPGHAGHVRASLHALGSVGAGEYENLQREAAAACVNHRQARQASLQTAAATRAFNTANMGFFEADQSPIGFDPTTGPLSPHFAAMPGVIAAAVPENTMKKDILAW